MELEFKPNVEVVNPARPEWGVGRILLVEPASGGHRVRVRFDGAGVKTMMVPPGRLAKPNAQAGPVVPHNGEGVTDEEAMGQRLQAIPEVIDDRHAGMEVRLGELIKLYRFSNERRDIFDWAVSQLGQKDPLGSFSADELGLYFSNYCRSRDRALKALYREARQMGLGEKFLAELNKNATGCVCRRMCAVLEMKG